MRNVTFRLAEETVTVPEAEASLLALRLRRQHAHGADEAAEALETALLSGAGEDELTARLPTSAAAAIVAVIDGLPPEERMPGLLQLRAALARAYG